MICKNITVYCILLTFFLSTTTNIALSQDEVSWNNNWSYKQEIDIPIDTDLNESKFQPIDIRISFNNPCWAKNETKHSVRLVCLHNNRWYELESQIYDLNYTRDSYINTCSLVFLIPEFADGKEKYYVYYDDEKKPAVDYPDHVNIRKEHYYYEPIPGQKADIDYYKIMDSGFCVYGIGIKGLMMTEYSTQMIFRQIKDKKDFSYKYWDRLTSFCFQYEKSNGDMVTTREKLISNDIYVDGNLMVSFGVASSTGDGSIKTTNVYKYYHSNLKVKRLCVNVKHEVFKDIQLREGELGSLVFSSGFKTRSEANQFLNTGEILPYIHFYNENNNVREIKIDTNPKSKEKEFIISVNDDYDLGNRAWFSIDEGEHGKAHAVIFSSNKNIIKSGKNERDGFQLLANQKQEVDIPGLKAYSSGIDCCRNAYEKGSTTDASIPSNLVVEFESEFLTIENRGYKFIQNESEIYHSLVKHRPSIGGNVSKKFEKEKLYNLTIFTHFSPSFPMGSLISTATGKNFSYTYAELYKDGKLVSSGICSRISLSGGLEIDTSNLSLKNILELFNWSRVSLFKKIQFPKLENGEYVVKIYRRVGDKNLFVGVKKIVLNGDKKIHIFCSRQGEYDVKIVNQNGKGISNVKCSLLLDNISFVDLSSGEAGECNLLAPMGRYKLRIIYNGFSLADENIKIGLLKKSKQINLDMYPLKIVVKDKLGLPPGVKNNVLLTSNEMKEPTDIIPEEIEKGVYSFENLLPANYVIKISYGSTVDEKNIKIPIKGNVLDMIFTPLFNLKLSILDRRGFPLKNIKLKVVAIRENKKIEKFVDNQAVFSLPPGTYKINAYSVDDLISSKKLDVTKDEKDYLLTTEDPFFPFLIEVFALISAIVTVAFFLLKIISFKVLLKLVVFISIVVALVLPWWGLYGSSSKYSIERECNAYLIPSNIVTITKFRNNPAGELSNIPQEFNIFLLAIITITLLGGFLGVISILIRKHRKIRLTVLFIGLIILTASAGIYVFAMNELFKVGLGGLQGSSTLNIENPFTGEYVNVHASWGLSIGFYILCFAISLMSISTFLELRFRSVKIKLK